jgi:sodium transport system permease protein
LQSKIVKAVFHKEVLELLRNRRSLMVMFGVPLLLYPLLTLAVGSLANTNQKELSQHSGQIVVTGGKSAEHLVAMLQRPEYHLENIDPAPSNPLASLKSGFIDAVIDVPPHGEADALAGKPLEFEIHVDSSHPASPFVSKKIDKLMDDYQQWILQQRLAGHGLPPTLAQPPKDKFTDMATPEQEFGRLFGLILPMLLLLTGMLGAMYPALAATTTERELGTLETLLVTPATRNELLTAKAAIVLISGLLTSLLNLISMSLVLWRMSPDLGKGPIVAIDPMALALSYLAAVPTLIFFSALVLMVGMMARNIREANSYATPIMLLPVGSMLIQVANPRITPGLMVTPVANTTLIIQDVLTGHAHFGDFFLAMVSSFFFAGLVLSMAGRLFTNEQLVNPAWEPISFRGFRRKDKSYRPRWPAIDEALTLFAISLLLNFYLSASWVKWGLLPLLAGVEILLIAAPAIIFAKIARYPWRDVFSLRPPSFRAVLGATFLGLGLIPVTNVISFIQQKLHILPQNQADLEGLSKLFEPTLIAHPFLAPIVVGLLAGVCEELLFRGPIHCALIRRLPVWAALATGGLLFAAAHLDLPGLPIRMLAGMMLGWIVWRTGSIFPAMLMHALYDGGSLGWGTYQLLHGVDFMTNPLTNPAGWIRLLVGIALLLAGFTLIRRASIIKTS